MSEQVARLSLSLSLSVGLELGLSLSPLLILTSDSLTAGAPVERKLETFGVALFEVSSDTHLSPRPLCFGRVGGNGGNQEVLTEGRGRESWCCGVACGGRGNQQEEERASERLGRVVVRGETFMSFGGFLDSTTSSSSGGGLVGDKAISLPYNNNTGSSRKDEPSSINMPSGAISQPRLVAPSLAKSMFNSPGLSLAL
ncbi:hypothetical protein CRG98_030772, partial [Punica granatum]